jgi:hypothetical protein
MNAIQSNLNDIINSIPYYYQQELLDYALFLKSKSEKETDTEYLESIPGMVESILESAKSELKDCSKELSS